MASSHSEFARLGTSAICKCRSEKGGWTGYAASTVPMIPFERQFQSLHSLQNYLHLNELLAPGWPMPIMDTEELRHQRAAFLERFCTRPYFMIRAATPQVLMDEADGVI